MEECLGCWGAGKLSNGHISRGILALSVGLVGKQLSFSGNTGDLSCVLYFLKSELCMLLADNEGISELGEPPEPAKRVARDLVSSFPASCTGQDG